MDPLEELGNKLAKHKESLTPKQIEKPASVASVAIEIVVGTCVGGILGYYIDQYLHTKVLFLLIFIILGLISSLYSIYKKYK